MTDHTARMLVMAMECQARIEAMKADNQSREMRGETQAYPAEHFFSIAGELEDIALRIARQD